nr:hypothetical protein [Deltaproteobacteria bacterium]
MFRGRKGYTERVDIGGTPKFMEFIEDLEKNEDIKVRSFEVGKDKLSIRRSRPIRRAAPSSWCCRRSHGLGAGRKSIAEEIASLDVHGFTLPDVTLSIVPMGVKTFVYEVETSSPTTRSSSASTPSRCRRRRRR